MKRTTPALRATPPRRGIAAPSKFPSCGGAPPKAAGWFHGRDNSKISGDDTPMGDMRSHTEHDH